MKKGQIITAYVEKVDFPNKGICRVIEPEENVGECVVIKNTLVGQTVTGRVNKIRHKKAEAALYEVIKRADNEIEPVCPHFAMCGGCTYQNLSYESQLELKQRQVEDVLMPAIDKSVTKENWYLGIKGSPIDREYRNKMEFTFGDEYKDGPLALGMHKRGSFYDIVTVDHCMLMHEDYRKILKFTVDYFAKENVPYFHRVTHEGYLRHLLVRRGVKTGEILVDIVTTTQIEYDLSTWVKGLCNLKLEGVIAGILHTDNDSLADAVKDEGTSVLYGEDYFYEDLLSLRFKITPFSFFQTNTLGAQVLYETAREFAMEVMPSGKKPVIFDLYSGTGTIGQMMAPVADHVIGVEIVEEAVVAAKENAERNGLHNCEFLAGDVLKVIEEIKEPKDQPDIIILDPPRDGCHPKALPKILAYGAPSIVYISCKVTSLARDLEMIQAAGYVVKKVVAIDQFPNTGHVESVVLITRIDK